MTHLRPIDRWFIAEVLPHEQALLSTARRLSGDADSARDLVQDAFARLFSLENWAAITSPRAYVMRMMRNQVVEQARRAQVVRFEQLTAIDTFDVADDAPDAFRVTSAREEFRRVEDAMRTLPERCRDVLTLRRFEERSPREIARLLGLSLSTLEKRLARGLHLLAVALERDVPAETDAAKSLDALTPDARTKAPGH